MRHIYEAGLVRGNFILTIGPVVGNVNLAKVLEEHKARAKDDKELTMTMVRVCSACCCSKLRVSGFFLVNLGLKNKEILLPKMKGLEAPVSFITFPY